MRGTKPTLVIDNDAVKATTAPPTWLSVEAKKEWRRVMPILVERRILSDADMGSLENYCLAQARVRDAEKMLGRTTNPDAWLKLLRAQDKAMGTARQIAAELGLTPVSRSRPGIREEEDGNDDADNPLDIS
ncbi:MAG: phage terminase small subunit P27 family [Devosia sp.]